MSPSGYYYLSKGETECNFSPRDGRMLEVNDCYVIADTLRFFSENYGAFCPSLDTPKHSFSLRLTDKPPPSSENEHLGDVSDWHSEYPRCIVNHLLVQKKNCPTIIA